MDDDQEKFGLMDGRCRLEPKAEGNESLRLGEPRDKTDPREGRSRVRTNAAQPERHGIRTGAGSG